MLLKISAVCMPLNIVLVEFGILDRVLKLILYASCGVNEALLFSKFQISLMLSHPLLTCICLKIAPGRYQMRGMPSLEHITAGHEMYPISTPSNNWALLAG